MYRRHKHRKTQRNTKNYKEIKRERGREIKRNKKRERQTPTAEDTCTKAKGQRLPEDTCQTPEDGGQACCMCRPLTSAVGVVVVALWIHAADPAMSDTQGLNPESGMAHKGVYCVPRLERTYLHTLNGGVELTLPRDGTGIGPPEDGPKRCPKVTAVK